MAGVRHPVPAGFTLIELLVVLGIIAAVVGGIGLAMRGGDDSVALGTAQRTMASMLTATRAQAVMNGTQARLIVHVDPDEPDRFLRKVGIMRRAETGGDWIPTSDGTMLPRGTYFVPNPNHVGAADGLFGGDWNPATDGGDAVSRYPDPRMSIAYPDSDVQARLWAYYEFGPDGQLTNDMGMNNQIVLTPGRRTQLTPVFENPENVRGLVIRRIGTFHLINERLSFHGTD